MADLNSSQHQAVHHSGQHLLIVAGPGTGKTHTLTQRILHFSQRLKDQERILAITFTNKAAHEMRERVSSQFPQWQDRIVIGTFHYFGLSLLRQYAQRIGISENFKIAAPEDIAEGIKEIWPQWKASQRSEILEQASRWKSVEFQNSPSEEVRQYQECLQKKGWLDFDDLLLNPVNLLKECEDVRKEIQQRYRFIFVDEYQDISPIQHQFLKLLVGPESHLTAIGDPNQAIYGFRGADVKFFESFTEDFPGAQATSLSENYRSSPNLLSASSQIMAQGRSLHVPELTAKIYTEGRLVIHETPTDKAEAEYVVHQIEKMVGGTSMFSHDSGRAEISDSAARSFHDIVVLYRLKAQRRCLEEALNRSGIPYRVTEQINGNPEDLVDPFSFRQFREGDNAEKVSLMTIHASKGLEFSVVFIVGCEEGLIPLDIAGMESDREEERRLFYVGMTRAKEQLFLTRSGRRFLYGKSYENAASPFLADIKEELKEYEKLQQLKRKKRNEDQMSLFS
ncbi:MAG: ATP-dependent helicase [Candidatus Omnitrophica bacterium]|nr:ATP-dependent helicase [Candidatus Omnitrophota bacterium]